MALQVLQNASEKARSKGENEVYITSNAIISVMKIHGNVNNQSNFYNAFQALQPLGERDLKIGIGTINARELALECSIASDELGALAIPKSGPNLQVRAGKLQEVGTRYQTQIGNRSLFISEFFFNTSITGMKKSLALFAESQENLAEATVWSDPKKAAELYQRAASYRRQDGDTQGEQMDLAKIHQYSKTVSCWFCQREIMGDQIQFLPMKAEIGPIRRGLRSDSPLPSMHGSEDIIYACRACNTAISAKANEIALAYHQEAMAKIIALQNQVQQLRGAYARR